MKLLPHLVRVTTLSVLLIFLVPSSPIHLRSQQLSAVEKKIAAYVSENSDDAISFLERVVNINSGTMNFEGVRAVGKVFQAELDALGFETKWIPMPDHVQRAGHLFAYRRGMQGKRLLLIGHLDTVFEKDSPFQKFERRDSVARGPGAEDMKGGDVVILYALKALQSVGALDNTSIIVAFTGDEEKVGHPIDITRKDLIEAAKQSDIALAFEGSVRAPTTATVARRGSSNWTLKTTGIQAHSGGIFDKEVGSGAIYEAARILTAFHEQLRGEKYLTFSPGVILGGTEVTYDQPTSRGTAFGKTNVVPPTAIVEGDLRFISESQLRNARATMQKIVSQNLPGTTAEISFGEKYPAMEPTDGNYAVLKVLDQVSRDLGNGSVEALDPGERGAGDISFIASYVDALDGIGSSGRGGHSLHEEVDLKLQSLLTQRAALLIYRLTREK